MITSSGIILTLVAFVIWLGTNRASPRIQQVIVLVLGGCGIGMLAASAVILSLRYLP